MLRAAQPAGHVARRELCAWPARRAHPPEGDQRRLPPVRAELLPPVPTGRLPRRDHRHLHGSHRLPLRRSECLNLRQGLPSWRRRIRYVACSPLKSAIDGYRPAWPAPMRAAEGASDVVLQVHRRAAERDGEGSRRPHPALRGRVARSYRKAVADWVLDRSTDRVSGSAALVASLVPLSVNAICLGAVQPAVEREPAYRRKLGGAWLRVGRVRSPCASFTARGEAPTAVQWCPTLSATVTKIACRTTEPSGSVSWATSKPNTIDARPRGPNHPAKMTVGLARPVPRSDMATGSIRTTVRLSTAYTMACHVTSPRSGPSRIAPNPRNDRRARRPPRSSAKSAASGSRS